MSDIFFSLIASAIRRDCYEGIYNNLNLNNKVPFEIIFAGDNPPNKTMPDNFKYIYTKVKPIQCVEICARRARGEYLMQIADDLVFSTEFLNRMHKHVKDHEGKKNIIIPRYLKGKKYDDSLLDGPLHKMYFDRSKKKSPRIGTCAIYKTKLWHELGGADTRFLGSYQATDMMMRFFEIGYELFDALDCCIYEIVKLGDFVRLVYRSNEIAALGILDDLWTKKGEILTKRNCPVSSFVDENILIESQGNKDKSQWD